MTDKNFYTMQAVLLAACGIVLWLVFDYTDLDMNISRKFYDAATGSWPWRDAFITSTVGHNGIKYVLVLYSIVLLVLLLYSARNAYWRSKRTVLAFLLLSMIIIPTEISFIKHHAHKPNPAQVTDFGGTMPHVKLTEFLQNEPDANNWPGGHASGGAALMSWYFVERYYSSKYKYLGLIVGIGLSSLMGFVQVMRGQHFFSHNLWTLWFAWLTLLLLYKIVLLNSKNKK